MNKVYFDITDLISWPGNLTGIQRVSFNLALRLKGELPNSEFVKYDKFNNKIVKASLNEIGYYNNLTVNFSSKANYFKSQNFKTTFKQSAIYKIGKEILPLFLKKIIVKIYKIIIFRLKTINDLRLSKQNKLVEEIIIKKGDVYLLTSANDNWNLGGVILYLKNQKKTINFKIIHVIYDLIPVNFSQFFGSNGDFAKQFTRYLIEVINLCDNFITTSNSVKTNLVDFINDMKLDPKPIEVMRLGDEINHNPKYNPIFKDSNKSYILSIGTFEVRKNYLLIYMAYKLAELKKIDLPKTIIVGKFGWLASDLKYLIEYDYNLENRIEVRHNVSDEELDLLYKNCLFTIYPSIYEGWGLPIAESLAYGKFCLSSNTSSMPEIAGDLIDYFNPYDARELLNKINFYLNKKELEKKEQLIKDKYKVTTWNQTAKQFYGYVKNLK